MALLESSPGRAFAGGTFQCRNTSPDGSWECEGSDVGGVRRRRDGQLAWQNLPTAGADADRKVAGAVILDDGTVFSLVGNAAKSGRILEYRTDGSVVVLQKGLHVLANRPSEGDKTPRPRPVGWMLHFDPVANILYACTGNGLYRHYRDKPAASGIIALEGESLRGFVHQDATTVARVANLTVCTRTKGIVRVRDVQGLRGKPTVTPTGSPTRAEDGAVTPGGQILAACHTQGLYRINPADGTSVNVTPAEVTREFNATGANGGPVMWTGIDCHPDTGIAIATMINPTHAHGWVFRSSAPIDEATADDWESITHTRITLRDGIQYAQPKARVPGGNAKNGKGLTGGQHASFVRSDRSGNTVKTLNTLTTGLSTNAMSADHSDVTWVSDVEESSLLSMVDVAVSSAGAMVITLADHNTMTSPSVREATTSEVERIGFPKLGDGYAVAVVDDVWVFGPCDDHHWESPNNECTYFRGAGAPTGWTPMGWGAHDWNRAGDFPKGLAPLPKGIPPRPVSACGHNNGDGTLRFFCMADGIGMVYQDYVSATDTWAAPRISQGGPTNDHVISRSVNTTRSSACSSDGSLVLHLLQKPGHLYRSLDRGATVERIASGRNGPEIAAGPELRSGFMRLHAKGDFAVVSNTDGIYVVKGLRASDPEVVQLSATDTGPIAIDEASGATFIHIRGAGPCQLLRFDDIASAKNLGAGENIASAEYSTHLGDQANQLYATRHDGGLYLITLYQGGGFLVSRVS